MEGGGGYDESYQARQEDEVDFLQAVFPEGFVDLRKNDPWDVRELEKPSHGHAHTAQQSMQQVVCVWYVHSMAVVCLYLQVKRPPEVGLMLVPQVSMGTSTIRPMAIRLLVKYPPDYPDRYV